MSEQVNVFDASPRLVPSHDNSAYSKPRQLNALPGRGIRLRRVSNRFMVLCCMALVSGQGITLSSAPTQRIEKARVDRSDQNAGPLYVSAGGREFRVTNKALNAWIVGGGRQVAYSAPDGAGGYENEGNALHLYDLQSGKERKILSEYFAIDRVTEVRTRNGKRAFLVEMTDGGLGASHVAVVDPSRGEVFVASKARLKDRTGDLLVLGFYRDNDWEVLANGKSVQPYRVRRYDLKRLLLRAPIHRVRAP